MFALSKQLQRLPIVSLQTGQPVALTSQPLIDPDKLELLAFNCTSPHWQLKQAAVLLARDIRQTSRDGLVIDSIDEIGNPDDIVRLKPIVKRAFKLLGFPVINESGTGLGRVEEYTINLDNFQIQKLYLKQSVLKNLLLNNLVIDRSQIVDVTSKHIVVRDATIKKPLLAPQPARPQAP